MSDSLFDDKKELGGKKVLGEKPELGGKPVLGEKPELGGKPELGERNELYDRVIKTELNHIKEFNNNMPQDYNRSTQIKSKINE